MIVRNINFVLFGDYKYLDAQPEKINKLFTSFLENGIRVVPGTFGQVNPKFGMQPFERIKFSNSEEQYELRISLDSIEIQKSIVNKKMYNIKFETEQFVRRISKIMSTLINSQKDFRFGVRTSLIIETLYDSNQINSLEEIYNKFNGTLPNYSQEEVFEWNTRAVKRTNVQILEAAEKLNIVTEVLRTSGQLERMNKIEEFDTIQSKVDINTVMPNNNHRINYNFIEQFLLSSEDLFNQIDGELEVRIIGNK